MIIILGAKLRKFFYNGVLKCFKYVCEMLHAVFSCSNNVLYLFLNDFKR